VCVRFLFLFYLTFQLRRLCRSKNQMITNSDLEWILKNAIVISFKILRRGADNSFSFPICNTFFFHGLKKLEQRSHKCVELRVNTCIHFFQSRSLFFSLKNQGFIKPPHIPVSFWDKVGDLCLVRQYPTRDSKRVLPQCNFGRVRA
jgi:hypothetical protein